MGMFDEIKYEYPLPDATVQDETFQTKSFDRVLTLYTITADGRLIEHTTRMEVVPEAERPHFGMPKWEHDSLYRSIGSLRSVPTGDVVVPHHGDIFFYTSTGSREDGTFEWYEYQARFTEGRLQWVKRVRA